MSKKIRHTLCLLEDKMKLKESKTVCVSCDFFSHMLVVRMLIVYGTSYEIYCLIYFNVDSERRFLLEKFSWQRYSPRWFAIACREELRAFEKFFGSAWNRIRDLWHSSLVCCHYATLVLIYE